MKTLIRNCLHSNDIYLLEKYDFEGKPIFIIKSSSSKNGINSLNNELRGLEWYNKLIDNKIPFETICKSENYIKMQTTFIDGEIISYSDGFTKNEKFINKIVEHYCKIWPNSNGSNNHYALHGDLSICNIIFDYKKDIYIIDWEHFNDNSAPIGFDALNLIFEQVWVESQFNSVIEGIIDPVVSLIQQLKKNNAIDNYFIEKPISKTKSFLKKNEHIWGDQITKLPVFKFEDSLINKIDKKIIEKL